MPNPHPWIDQRIAGHPCWATCANPRCRESFVRPHPRQAYCTVACANRARLHRLYWADHDRQRAIRTRSRAKSRAAKKSEFLSERVA